MAVHLDLRSTPASPDALRLLIADDEPLGSSGARRRGPGAHFGLCASTDEVATGLARVRPDVALLTSACRVRTCSTS
jgi:hypothetical protein